MGKFNAKLLFAIFMVLILCSVQAIAAADDAGDIVASDNGDLSEEISNDNVINNDQLMASNDDALAAEPGTFTDLKNEISKLDSNNSTLVLSKDYVRADNENTISISKKVNITIIGNGHKIDANQLGTIFTVSSPVVLKDIVFVNSVNKYSSAISLQPNSAGSIIDLCTFENNNGGAITVNADDVTITDSTFINNTNKAAIYILNNNAVVSKCNFINNTNGG